MCLQIPPQPDSVVQIKQWRKKILLERLPSWSVFNLDLKISSDSQTLAKKISAE